MTRMFSPYRKPISALRWVLSFVAVVILVWIWAQFLRGELRSFKVISGSMEPTLRIGDFVLAQRPNSSEPLLGRIIAFEEPSQQGEIVTKRVVAVAGDRVAAFDRAVYVNGKPLPVPWQRVRQAKYRRVIVPRDHVFVLGDNRENSVDSLDYGPIPKEKIIGVVFLRYWPLSALGRL